MSDFQYWFICVMGSVCISIGLVRGPMFDLPKGFIIKHLPKRLEEEVAKAMYCSMCAGFWIGLLSSIFLGVAPVFLNTPCTVIITAFVVSIVSILMDRIIFGIDKFNDLDQ